MGEEYEKEKLLKNDVNGMLLWSVKNHPDFLIREYPSEAEAKRMAETLDVFATCQDPNLGLPTSFKKRMGNLVIFYDCEERVAVVKYANENIKNTQEISEKYAKFYEVSIQKSSETIRNFFEEQYKGLVDLLEIVFGLDKHGVLRIMEISTNNFSRKNGGSYPQSSSVKERFEELKK